MQRKTDTRKEEKWEQTFHGIKCGYKLGTWRMVKGGTGDTGKDQVIMPLEFILSNTLSTSKRLVQNGMYKKYEISL